MDTMQTLATSVVVGMIIAGIFAFAQIPLNKRRKRATHNDQSVEYRTFAEVLHFIEDDQPTTLASEARRREIKRQKLIEDVKDRMRIYDSRKELDELERSSRKEITVHG